jgi:hypothetical protein
MTVVLKKRRNQSSPLSISEVDSNWDTIESSLNAPSANGTVTSVTVGNLSPLFNSSVATSTSTPAISFAQISQTANRLLIAPDGTNGVPTFRTLVAGDLPIIPISKGGTGSAAAITNNRVIVSSGGVITSGSVSTTDLFYISGLSTAPEGILRKAGTSLTTSSVSLANADTTGILPINKGGTGITTTPSNGRLLIGNGSGYSLSSLTAGSGISITNGAGTISIASSIPTINSLSGALTINTGTSGSDIAVNSSSTTITINIPTATSSARGALSSTDWSTFNNKIGRTFTTGNTITFGYDVWYITGNATLPDITAGDVGKVLFVKNIGGSNYLVTTNNPDTIDGNIYNDITLTHASGGNVQGAVILQARTTTNWEILGHYGTTTLG